MYVWIGGTNIAKMFIVPRGIYIFSIIPTKIPTTVFLNIEKNHKRSWVAKQS